MKGLKILVWLAGLIIAFIVAVLIYISLNLNTLIKRTVEDVGPDLTQTPVTLNKVDVSLKDGRVSLFGFDIANPDMFTSDKAFRFDEVSVQIKPESLTGDVVIIEDIIISGIAITAEQKGSNNNLMELKKSISSYLPPGSQQNSSQESSGASKRFMLKHIKFDNSSLNLITEKYGEKSVTIPGFEMSNIGSPEQGMSVEQIASIVMQSVTDRARRAAEKELRDLMTEEANARVREKLDEKKQEGLDKLKGLLKD